MYKLFANRIYQGGGSDGQSGQTLELMDKLFALRTQNVVQMNHFFHAVVPVEAGPRQVGAHAVLPAIEP